MQPLQELMGDMLEEAHEEFTLAIFSSASSSMEAISLPEHPHYQRIQEKFRS